MSDVAAGKRSPDKQEPQPLLERLFALRASGSNVRTEFVAGLTTFLTMVYIVFVNPQILGSTGMDKGAVFVATCIAAAVSTLVMALYANYPLALAPGRPGHLGQPRHPALRDRRLRPRPPAR